MVEPMSGEVHGGESGLPGDEEEWRYFSGADRSDEIEKRHADLSWVSVHDASDAELRWMEWADDALAEVRRLRTELRRFQRIVIDASEGTADCEDLCMVLCAGPCQGVNVPAHIGSSSRP
jgi:hypothetical protein